MNLFKQKDIEPVWKSRVGNTEFREANKGPIAEEMAGWRSGRCSGAT